MQKPGCAPWTKVLLSSLLALTGLRQEAQSIYLSNPVKITPEEAQAIAAGRKRGARPRPTASSGPMNSVEASRVRAFEAAKGSVVFISSSTQRKLVDPDTGEEMQIPAASGTGFVWDKQGHVVTNHHVLEVDDPTGQAIAQAEELKITLANGKSYKALVIGKSLSYDIAVLRIFAPLNDLKPLPLGRSKELKVGQSVLAIGNPFGYDHTLTQGIISGLGREVLTDAYLQRGIREAIQTDAAINPGNSGGPLLNSSGHLIGMNTSVKSRTGENSGVSFAIPVDTLNRMVPLLIERGKLVRPMIGFSAVPAAIATQLGVTQGIAVGDVVPDTPAARAGFHGWVAPDASGVAQLGDIVIGFQGRPVLLEVQLADMLELESLEAPLVFDILRNGQRLRLVIPPENLQGRAPANSVFH